MTRGGRAGFTLVEVMLVVVVLGIIAGLGFNQYNKYVAKTRRSEVFAALRSLTDAQESYYARNGQFAGTFDAMDFVFVKSEKILPTEIETERYTYYLSQPYGDQTWYCLARGNIDSDEFMDMVAGGNLTGDIN